MRVVIGCNTFPTDPPNFSMSQVEVLNPDVLYVCDIDSGCGGCVTALNLCYRPTTTNSNERILTVVFINSERIIVYTHDVYVNPVSMREQEGCMQSGVGCCVAQTLKPSERFFVSGHDLGLRTYTGVSSPLRSNLGSDKVNGGWIAAPSGMYNNGSSAGNVNLGSNIHLPMLFFNITSSKKNDVIIAVCVLSCK